MYLFFWERNGRRLVIIAAWVILLMGVMVAAVKLIEIPSLLATKEIKEELSPQPQLSPLAKLPLVTYVEGYPEGKNEKSDAWELLETGSELDQGSVIRTDETSVLDIRLQTGTVLRVMKNTTLSLATLYQQKVELKVEKGTVLARVKRLLSTQSFDFLTPSVVAGIRGTELIVLAAPEGTTVFGMSGKIELYNPKNPEGKVVVGLQEKSYVKKRSKPTEVVAMTPEEIERYRKLLDSMRENPVFIVSSKITFLPDSVQLTPEALIAIEAMYEQLLSVQSNIKIVGHTTDIGTPESQFEISKGRAQSVIDYLVTLGMPASKLSAIGLGSTQPISYDDATMDKNRRVEFIIE